MNPAQWIGSSPLFINQSLDFTALHCDCPSFHFLPPSSNTLCRQSTNKKDRDGRRSVHVLLPLSHVHYNKHSAAWEGSGHWPRHSSELVMRSGFMADPQGEKKKKNRPEMGNNPSTFTACVATEFSGALKCGCFWTSFLFFYGLLNFFYSFRECMTPEWTLYSCRWEYFVALFVSVHNFQVFEYWSVSFDVLRMRKHDLFG